MGCLWGQCPMVKWRPPHLCSKKRKWWTELSEGFPLPPSVGPIFAGRGLVISGRFENRFGSGFGMNPTGCKENHFYSLPFSQAEGNIILLAQTSFELAPKAFWRAELISQLFCYLNSSKKITCSSGYLKTKFTSLIAKSTSPGLSDTTFFARWPKIIVFGYWPYIYAEWLSKYSIWWCC